MQKQWKNQKANQQNQKKNKSKIKTEKRGKKQNGKKHGKMNLSICICFAFILFSRLFFVAFILHLFCFLPGKKHTTCKIKAKNKSKKQNIEMRNKCKWTSPFFPHVFSLLDVPFFPIYSPPAR